MRSWLVLITLFLGTPHAAFAHPVLSGNHDRAVLVRLKPTGVVISYRMEVDARWVSSWEVPRLPDIHDDLKRDPASIYTLYRKYLTKSIQSNLVVRLDGQELPLTLVKGHQEVINALRCEYTFRADWNLCAGQRYSLDFKDLTYSQDKGLLVLSLATLPGIRLVDGSSAEAKIDPLGEDERARWVRADFELVSFDLPGINHPTLAPDPIKGKEKPTRQVAHPKPRSGLVFVVTRAGPSENASEPTATKESDILHLLLDTNQGFGVLLLMAAGFGAIHALTPGHGKTLVAAYLIGERGTTWHALFLGLVTTISHTIGVILLALLLPLFFPKATPAEVQAFLGLVGGLLIVGLGFWLLLCRVANRPDHVHIGGGHHHHHDHDTPADGKPGWWGLIVLGISGGIVPCWDALFLLLFCISSQRLWMGVPLLIAFSAGLASVLVGLGLIVVHSRRYANRHWGESASMKRLFRFLPIVSAVIVMMLGFWLCYGSLHGQ